MKNKTKLAVFLLGLFLGLVTLMLCVSEIQAATIKLGAIIDKTGATGDVGKWAWRGIEDFVTYINEKGGVNGKKIQLIIVDDEYNVTKALTLYQQLKAEGVAGIIGWGTGGAQSLSPHVNNDKIPFIPGSLAENLVDPITPYVFLFSPSYNDEFFSLLRYAHSHPKQSGRPVRVAFAFNSSPYGMGPIAPAEKLAKELGVEIVGKEIVELKAADADEQMTRLLAAKPDYLLTQETAPATIAILKSCKKVGLDTTVMATFYGGDEKIIDAVGDAAKDYVVVSPFSKWYDEGIEGINVIKEFSKAHNPDMNEWPLTYIEGWVLASIFTEAIKNAGDNVTGERVQRALEAMKGFSTGGLSAKISFGPTDHKGARGTKLYKADINTKRFIPLSGWTE